ncbi:MAG: family 43 glycosylhydrolase, partial [Armatimonadota bacterium]|nr:family 43 glycosylhydrolase [Armatimonadota bacterium]
MRMISKLSLLFICLLLAKCASAYRNPLVLPKEAEGPGIADPGLLRWMGKYYLYSTKTGEQGIRCWESADLVNWQFKAYCTDDDPVFASRMAWSPAPFYFNGKFYLYICGIDQKHKVFESENPWGPFRCVNADFLDVNTLDAVPFLDDDGKLYLFYAGWSRTGIQWRTCSSPINADEKNQKLIACQFSVNPNNWWTEGPAVFKRNGIYYLTYCGNNWQEDNYQIRAAKGYTIAS